MWCGDRGVPRRFIGVLYVGVGDSSWNVETAGIFRIRRFWRTGVPVVPPWGRRCV